MFNPFTKRGVPVNEDSFIGRHELVNLLFDRLSSGANCSIVGLPRMGKTSLAKKLISKFDPNSNKKIAFLSLDSVSSPAQAFCSLMELISVEAVVSDDITHDRAHRDFLNSTRKLSKLGLYHTIVLDELDSISNNKFSDAPLFISRLREIASSFDLYGVNFLFISRRSLDVIQGKIDYSTLAGLCDVRYVKPFELSELKQLMNLCPCQFDKPALEFLYESTGGHPFFASIILCEVLDKKPVLISKSNIEDGLKYQTREHLVQYNLYQNILGANDLFESLCQLTKGPYWTKINPLDISTLKEYGLMRKNENGYYEVFSSHFGDFLESHLRKKPTWVILGEAEKTLREIINANMTEKYGEDWLQQFKSLYPEFLPIITNLENQKTKEERIFGDHASNFMLDYTYIGDLVGILNKEWSCFSSIFSGKKKDWNDLFECVAKVRNPLAHNRQLPPGVIISVEKACKAIIDKVKGI